MKKISDLISKSVYSLSSGAKIGYILNVEFSSNLDKLLEVIVVDDETEMEGKVEIGQLVFGQDAIFLKDTSSLSYGYENNYTNPIGKLVFDKKGSNLGVVKDIVIQGKKVICIVTETLTFAPKNICVNGFDALIVFGKKQKEPVFNFKNKFSNEQLVKIPETINATIVTPAKITPNVQSLIGKMATRDILGLNNELIIKKHEIITQKKIIEAKKHNKLNILFYNCK